jgi:hypothetical protein
MHDSDDSWEPEPYHPEEFDCNAPVDDSDGDASDVTHDPLHAHKNTPGSCFDHRLARECGRSSDIPIPACLEPQHIESAISPNTGNSSKHKRRKQGMHGNQVTQINQSAVVRTRAANTFCCRTQRRPETPKLRNGVLRVVVRCQPLVK